MPHAGLLVQTEELVSVLVDHSPYQVSLLMLVPLFETKALARAMTPDIEV